MIYPYNNVFEQPEEELIEFKGEQKTKTNKFSSEKIRNEVLTLTSETSYSEYCFETKLRYKFDKSDQILEQLENKLVDFT